MIKFSAKTSVLVLLIGLSVSSAPAIFESETNKKKIQEELKKSKKKEAMLQMLKDAINENFGLKNCSEENYNSWKKYIDELKKYTKDSNLSKTVNQISDNSKIIINARKALSGKSKDGNVTLSTLKTVRANLEEIKKNLPQNEQGILVFNTIKELIQVIDNLKRSGCNTF